MYFVQYITYLLCTAEEYMNGEFVHWWNDVDDDDDQVPDLVSVYSDYSDWDQFLPYSFPTVSVTIYFYIQEIYSMNYLF